MEVVGNMDRSKYIGLLGAGLLVLGIVVLLVAIAEGEASVALVVIIPVIYGGGALLVLAVLLIFAGFLLLSASFARRAPREEGPTENETKREFGGVVLIGPIPIVFGSARALRGTWALVALAALSLIVLLLFLFILLR
jgi:uncharacterized protein (TIGR00304 family)